jgi:predicted Ser/Thr protein kinase
MAKIDAFVPEPKKEYDVSQQRQTLEALNTLINQLNFGYQKDLKDEQKIFEWFLF